ncbi:SIR2 family protein [Stenotrophomonas sp. YIM B06876]|uniref:SIR2 family protein n=1 Tax=Stenotrophomonas sp. YIM B06876 TaxID=3060211 RepID=UPI00273A2D1F|nr:SIR2 family protein [Stenotrophomonas sp. YIM B06876]
MPSLKFDPEATVEEIAGIGRHAAFDSVVDDKDDDAIQVVCKRADGTEIPLANPARAFYFGDRILYTEEARRYDLGGKQRTLNTDTFPRNERRFDELKRACQRGFVIPFVGAGMSKSAGCPEWKEYLLNLCPEAGLDEATMRHRLEDHGAYEGVMHDLVTNLGEARFNLDFERDFTPPGDLAGAVLRLPDLFDNCVITTNFDRVLEMAYEKCGKAFVEKTTGRAPAGSINAFYRAIPAGDRHLLKLHGNLNNAAERVLNRGEYDSAYGNDGNIHFDFPLPKLLRRLYTSFSFLFLGCSLSYDRTIQSFAKIAQDMGADSLPHHYAILASPSDTAKKANLEQRLADAHISAIWFPEGEYQHIEAMLELLSV